MYIFIYSIHTVAPQYYNESNTSKSIQYFILLSYYTLVDHMYIGYTLVYLYLKYMCNPIRKTIKYL